MSTSIPTAAVVERSLGENSADWRHAGKFHVTFVTGIELGLRRFDKVLLAIETSDGTNLYANDLGAVFRNFLIDAEATRPYSYVPILVFAADRSQWTGLSKTTPTIAVIDLIRVRRWDSQHAIQELRKAILAKIDLKLINPFMWQTACEDNMFFGRERELQRILLSPKQSFAIVGPRRIGKSSLLRRLRLELAPYARQQYLHLDCSGIENSYELAEMLLRRISPRQYFGGRGYPDIESEVVAAASRLGLRYLVGLDEFDAIAKAPVDKFERIKPWFTGRFQGRMRFVVAGYGALWDSIENRESYLFNVFTPITLGPFEKKEAELFVRQTLSELEIPVISSQEAIDAILSYTGLQPWLLQAFCSRIVDHYASRTSDDPLSVVNQIAESIEIQQMVFKSTAQNCSPMGNAILACIASGRAHDELSLFDAFDEVGITVSVERMIKEISLLQIAGAVDRSLNQVRLSSKLLRLHLNAFWTFEEATHVLRNAEPGHRKDRESTKLALDSSSVIDTPPPSAVEIFYSYSHKDESLRSQLEKHLGLLKRHRVILGWHDRRITPGQEWEGEISKHVNSAKVILLLISADFLASDYCYDVEMSRALERHASGSARVIPVILRACDWSGARFGKLQALPKNAKPVTSWRNMDEAFTDVAKGIRLVISEMRSEYL